MANSEGPYELPYSAAFYQDLHCQLKQKYLQIYAIIIQFYLEIIACDLSTPGSGSILGVKSGGVPRSSLSGAGSGGGDWQVSVGRCWSSTCRACVGRDTFLLVHSFVAW